ncbi:MAG: hypothetical protein ACJ70O_04155 [Nitrososphaera sp.]
MYERNVHPLPRLGSMAGPYALLQIMLDTVIIKSRSKRWDPSLD